MKLKSFTSAIFISVFIAGTTILAAPLAPPEQKFKKLVAIGDSFTDSGNVFNLTNHLWPSAGNFFEGRFSNGKMWVEYLSELLGAELENKAYGGATSDNDLVQGFISKQVVPGATADIPVPGMKQQVDEYLSENDNHEDNLYAFWDAGNDYFFSSFSMDPLKVVESMGLSFEKLVAAGAKSFLVADIEDFSKLPFFKNSTSEMKTTYQKIVKDHNEALSEYMKSFVEKHNDVQVYRYITVEMFDYYTSIEGQKELKISNVTDACNDVYSNLTNPVICDKPDDFIFWDAFHVTTKLNSVIANDCLKAITKS
ncbi:5511_t:CDS:2 [Funneliformis caledonium]|uniref:5511_t:CDS:1 n=1 Tax=Funneliformis caledonium TaxID=1117310 RepID=A0A9N9B3Q0_9GLOM|nr:5511_t:CDS:2 [Funneliformis caledonium]